MSVNRGINRTSTMQHASNVITSVMDPNLCERYGTSVDEFRSKKHQVEIQARIRDLRGKFQLINKDKNSFITVDELTDYFNETKNEGDGDIPFTREYFEKIFKMLDKNQDSELVLEEFINGYIFLEETIKAKRVKFQKALEELEDNLKSYKDKQKRHLNEYQIGNELTNESMLYVSIYEARNLNGNLIGSCNPFVLLSFEGKTQQTNLKKNNTNPAWNEDFKFNVTNPNAELVIELYNQAMIGSTKLGSRCFPLRDFPDQEKQVSWYPLQDSNNTTTNSGEISLKVQYIKSFNKYYNDKISTAEHNYATLSETYEQLQTYCDRIKDDARGFGAIYLGQVDTLLNDTKMKNCEQILNEMERTRKLMYIIRPDDDDQKGLMKVISWGKSTKVLMFLYILCAIISLFARSDFVNFFISTAILVLLIYDKKYDIKKYLLEIIIAIGGSLAYDVVWVVMKWGEFWKGRDSDVELGMKNCTYVVSIIEMVVKGILIPRLLALKKKKEKQSM